MFLSPQSSPDAKLNSFVTSSVAEAFTVSVVMQTLLDRDFSSNYVMQGSKGWWKETNLFLLALKLVGIRDSSFKAPSFCG